MKNLFYLLIFTCFISCGSDEEPTVDPVNTTITPNVGVGDITFESNGNDVIAQDGAYSSINAQSMPGGVNFTIWYDGTGMGYQLDSIDVGNLSLQEIVDMADDLVDLEQHIVQMVIMSPFPGATSDGIQLGSTKSDVVAVYGTADKVTSLYEEYDALNASFWYTSVDSTVRRIDLRK